MSDKHRKTANDRQAKKDSQCQTSKERQPMSDKEIQSTWDKQEIYSANNYNNRMFIFPDRDQQLQYRGVGNNHHSIVAVINNSKNNQTMGNKK